MCVGWWARCQHPIIHLWKWQEMTRPIRWAHSPKYVKVVHGNSEGLKHAPHGLQGSYIFSFSMQRSKLFLYLNTWKSVFCFQNYKICITLSFSSASIKSFLKSRIKSPPKLPSPPSLKSPRPARNYQKRLPPRTPSPPSRSTSRLSRPASGLSLDSGPGASSPVSSVFPSGRSVSGRSVIRSLDELFSEAADTHSSSSSSSGESPVVQCWTCLLEVNFILFYGLTLK